MYPYNNSNNNQSPPPSQPDMNDPNLHNNPTFLNMVANMNMGSPMSGGFIPWGGVPVHNSYGWGNMGSPMSGGFSPPTMLDSQRMSPPTQQFEDDDETVQETQTTAPNPPKRTNKRSHQRKSSEVPREKPNQQAWTAEEQMALARAWLEVTEDPRVANYQKDKTYWSRIRDIFHSILGRGEYRLQDSITSKFNKMRKSIQAFNQCYVRQVNRHQSGISESDLQANAMAEYRATNPAFQYLNEWNYLKNTSKWHLIRDYDPIQTRGEGGPSKRSKTTSESEPQSESGSDARVNIDLNEVEDLGDFVEVRHQRPLGRDASKRAAKGKGKGKAPSSSSEKTTYSEEFLNLTGKLDGLIGVGNRRADIHEKKTRKEG